MKDLFQPSCPCETVVRNALSFDGRIFLLRIEHKVTNSNKFSNLKVTIEDSFAIEDSSKKRFYLLGFTIQESNHYYGYLFNKNNGEYVFVKVNDQEGVFNIQYPWNEILMIDSDRNKRPTTFIYGEADDSLQLYLSTLASNIMKHRGEPSLSISNSSSRPSMVTRLSSITYVNKITNNDHEKEQSPSVSNSSSRTSVATRSSSIMTVEKGTNNDHEKEQSPSVSNSSSRTSVATRSSSIMTVKKGTNDKVVKIEPPKRKWTHELHQGGIGNLF